MEKRATRYRGYLGWLIEAHPPKPDLPILREAAFQEPKPSWLDAVAQARAHIDAVLSVGELMGVAPIANIGGSGQYE